MDSILGYIMDRIIILPGILIGLSFHEFAHAKVSSLLGDPTPKAQGRVSLNPVAHVDPIGFIALLLLGFGWGKPVQVNPGYYKKRRLGEILVSLAGVTMNLLIAIVGTAVMRLVFTFGYSFINTGAGAVVWQILIGLVQINLVLMFFNLIPLPPLDGFNVVTQIFKLDQKDWYYKFYQLGPMFLLFIIVFNITSKIISPAVGWSYMLLINLFF